MAERDDAPPPVSALAPVVPITRDMSRSRRHRDVRATTIGRRHLVLVGERRRADYETGEILRELGYPNRPQTRADCASVPRPCPWVSCRFNLYLDVSERTGSIKLNFPDLEPDQIPPDASCALDVADEGARTLEEASALMNVTRERFRQLESKALVRLRRDGVLPDSDEMERPRGYFEPEAVEGKGGVTGSRDRGVDEGLRADLWRVFRPYEREQRERDCEASGASFATSAQPDENPIHGNKDWNDDDQVDVDRWGVEVLGALRGLPALTKEEVADLAAEAPDGIERRERWAEDRLRARRLRGALANADLVMASLEPLESSVAPEDGEGDDEGVVDVLGRPAKRRETGVDHRAAVLAAIRRLEPVTGGDLARELARIMSHSTAYACANALIAAGLVEKVGDEIRTVRERANHKEEQTMPHPKNEATKEEIIKILARGPARVTELVEQTGVCQSSVNKALVQLAEAKLVRKQPGSARNPWEFLNGTGPNLLPPAPSKADEKPERGRVSKALVSRRSGRPPSAAVKNGTADVVMQLQSMLDELDDKRVRLQRAIEALAG